MAYRAQEKPSLGLYFHIPFCLSKCAYCDFNSCPPKDPDVVKKYISALIAHMGVYRTAARKYRVDSVFIGGGTPTSIPPKELYRLIKAIRKNFPLSEDCEFSSEANPATVSTEMLLKMRKLGVNRLSMGLQSAHDRELEALGRKHTRRDFIESFRCAREAGFDNINVDLMFGIPYQTKESLSHTINYLCGLGPEHISLYDLKIEPGTQFGKNYAKIKPTLPEDDVEAEMYLDSIETLRLYGYRQYEISNFARQGFECRHNRKYWNCDEYIGFGVSAHSYFRGKRFSFTPNIEKYISGTRNLLSKVNITETCEEVVERERMGEYIMLRLRLTDGINEDEFVRRFGISFDTLYGEKCKRFLKHNYMTHKDGAYALTPRGFFISNYILSDLLEFEDFGHYFMGT